MFSFIEKLIANEYLISDANKDDIFEEHFANRFPFRYTRDFFFWMTFNFNEDFAITDYGVPISFIVFFKKQGKLKELFKKKIKNRSSLDDFVKCSKNYDIYYNRITPGVFYLLDFDYIMIVSSNENTLMTRPAINNQSIGQKLKCLSNPGKKPRTVVFFKIEDRNVLSSCNVLRSMEANFEII